MSVTKKPNNGEVRMNIENVVPENKFYKVPHKQRALVFQGGGALGAYEAGAFKAIYKYIIEKEGKKSQDTMFDVIAGTSIGAINATILVDYVIKEGTWKGSVKVLEDFWEEMKNITWADNSFFKWWWDQLRSSLGSSQIALPETARRYWSWAQLACTPSIYGGGTSHLYFPHLKILDTTFLNPFVFPHGISYDYSPLKQFLSNRIKFPIKTKPGDPRLLIVSVDVKDCTTAVTFDSYASSAQKCDLCDKEFNDNRSLVSHIKKLHIKLDDENNLNIESGQDELWYSTYGEGENNNKHVVFYNGIGLEQVTAGCMIPQSIDHPNLFDYISHENRTYWDGGLLSNTPLRELLQRHKDYWLSYSEGEHNNAREEQEKVAKLDRQNLVPDLEVVIVDLFPAIEQDKQIPLHGDIMQDRINDIRFHDRTVYDQKVAVLVSDYVSFSNTLIDLCKRLMSAYTNKTDSPGMSQIDLARQLLEIQHDDGGNRTRSKIDSILNDFVIKKGIDTEGKREDIILRILREKATSYHRSRLKRKYKDLLNGTFNVYVTRIERQDDPYTISGKVGDFSDSTITDLIKRGDEETTHYLNKNGLS